MLLFPNCKINLGLNIMRKREDGYHDLETVFYPIKLQDALEGLKKDLAYTRDITFTSTGLSIEGNTDNNLCVKAYHLLQKDFPEMPGIQMHLHKNIPMGAGLGGGSADGAFTLLLLNELCRLQLSEEQLMQYALQLGSDCPFFILNKPCFASGRGEKMEPVDLDLSQYHFVLINPNIHISTAEAFSKIKPAVPEKSIADIIHLPVHQWKDLLVNDFEISVTQSHPSINKIKQELYNAGALYASMTGSGSTVYGLFEKGKLPQLTPHPTYQVYYIQ